MWKIIQVSDLAPPHIGGVENIVWKYSALLKNAGYDIKILTTKLPNATNTEVKDGIKIIRLNKASFFMSAFHKVIKDVDIIHTHSYLSSLTFNFYKKINKKKVIIKHVHDIYGDKLEHYTGWSMSSLFKKYEKYLIKGEYNCYIVPSRYTKQKLIELDVPKDQIEVLPHGINYTERYDDSYIRRKYDIADDTKIIGFVGRLSTGKGPQYLIKLMPSLVKKYNVILILVGPNPDKRVSGIVGIRNNLEIQVKKLHIEKNVIFAGAVPESELPYYFYGIDVLVAPSISEGFGLTVLEALNAGKPVIAFNSGALPELVIDGKNGKLVSWKDLDKLKQSIELILSDQQLYDRYAQYAKESVKQYQWDKILTQLIKIYDKYAQ